MKIRRSLRWAAAACALAVVIAACSGNSTSPKPAASPGAEPTSGAAAQQQIAANWSAFFDASTPVSKRIALLQDGHTFASVIEGQAGSGLASQATAKVSKVAVTSPGQAAVGYSILIAGRPALPNQSGTAVYQDGSWKVGTASFCGLLALQAGGSTAALPAACKTVP